MTDKLSLYNGALRFAGERKLASLSEKGEKRNLLDDAWDNQAVDYCLEQAQWYFAMRAARLDSDPSYTAPFGFRYRFQKPADWIRTSYFCQDEYFNVPLTRNADEAGSWFADLTPVYAKWVSNDPAYGNNLGIWPPTFQQLVQCYLGLQIAPKLTASAARIKDMTAQYHAVLADARTKAAMAESEKFNPPGTWTQGRRGNRAIGWDRGNRNTMFGG
jgi:hypothetical protein